MKELKLYLLSLFRKQNPAELVEMESIETKKAFILSEKHRIYQESMSNYLSRYMQFLEGLHE